MTDEALDFSIKKVNLASLNRSPDVSTSGSDRASGSPTSTTNLTSPRPSFPSTADLFRKAMLMDPAAVSGLCVPGSPTGIFSTPSLSLMPTDPTLLPTTSLALSALHRRRRRTSSSDQTDNLKKPKAVPEEHKDQTYWERRRKNNDAAKRSRDTRKAKEDEIALRAAYLEQENLKLKAQVNVLKNEMARLHCLLFSQIQS